MADTKWTKAQREVIDVRDKNVLVAAAAGSGKTAVLVEHIISIVTGEGGKTPVDIDKLLVVTYTRAAAAEMRERVMLALQRKLKEMPEDTHIRNQLTYIHNAKIMTIDSFCNDVVRTYFNEIDIDPGFKIADNGDLELLKADVMSELLENKYAVGDEQFHRFVDTYSGSKSDSKIEDEIWSLYRYARSYPDPEKWLKSLYERYENGAKDNKWLDAVRAMIGSKLDGIKASARRILALAYDFGEEKIINLLSEECNRIFELELSEDFDENGNMLSSISFGRFPTIKGLSDADVLRKDAIKNGRADYKKSIETLVKKYYKRPYKDILEDMSICAPMVGQLGELTLEFDRMYRAAKLDKNMTDFSDIEHYALDILAKKQEDGSYIPTSVAKEMATDIYEIMIDEYQDSNLVQEIILNAVAGRGKGESNVFMVGDVKQSIYKFRQARPELFLDKYNRYPLTDESDNKKIVLSKNFRSRSQVLDCCNMIFEQIMVGGLGGIDYDDNNKLYNGMDFPEGADDYKAEIMFVDTEELKELDEEAPAKIELEAAMTLGKIKELVDGTKDKLPMQIYDKDMKCMRNLRYGDIAILFRSTKGYAEIYTDVFMQAGVPVHTTMSEGYFDVFEISVLLDMLSVIDNPRQDIKLAAVLKHIFGLTDNMLADIRCQTVGEARVSFYEAFSKYDGVYKEYIDDIKYQLDQFRTAASYMSIYDLILYVLEATHFREFIMASKSGDKRMANVEMLLSKARKYEEGAYSGLFNFVRYIELMKKYNVEEGEANLSGENDDSVKIMTIHKSKGLEYPVVFVGAMGKKMNMADVSKSIIIHPDLGVGVDRVDTTRRLRYKTLIKESIGASIKSENLAEELRVLYVALTRAREKLILTGVGNVTKKRDEYAWLETVADKKIGVDTLCGATTYLDWMMMATARAYTEDYVRFNRISPRDIMYSKVQQTKQANWHKEALSNWDVDKLYNGDVRYKLDELFSYEYKYAEECHIRQKMSISDIKHMYMRMSADEERPAEEVHFGNDSDTGPSKGALRGTAYHRVFELFDYDMDICGVEDIEVMMSNMVASGLIDQEGVDLVDATKVYEFAMSKTASDMRKAYKEGKLYREKPFVMGIPACEIEPDKYTSKELVVVQGIVDAWYDTKEGIVVVDYKTDNVECIEDLRARYESQLVYYGDAIMRIADRPIKELVIYSVKFNKELII